MSQLDAFARALAGRPDSGQPPLGAPSFQSGQVSSTTPLLVDFGDGGPHVPCDTLTAVTVGDQVWVQSIGQGRRIILGVFQ